MLVTVTGSYGTQVMTGNMGCFLNHVELLVQASLPTNSYYNPLAVSDHLPQCLNTSTFERQPIHFAYVGV